ncbi:MAG: SdrD B-like domain-containing protein, partial [Candidatus Latescibacterota bacterium]
AQPGDIVLSRYTDIRTSSSTPVEREAETIVLLTQIVLVPDPRVIVANGSDRSVLTAQVTDEQGRPLPDGTIVQFTADKGTFPNGTGHVDIPVSGGNGEAVTQLIAPVLAKSDTARVIASFAGFDSDIVKLVVLPGAVGVRVYDQLRQTEVLADDPSLRVEVKLTGTTVTGDPVTITVTVDKNGIFVVPDIPPGKYELTANVQEIATGRMISNGVIQSITVNADGSASAPKNAISGMVHGRGEESGARYAGAGVELVDAQGTIVASTVLDKDGRYDFQNLDPGSFTLRVKMTDGTVITQPISSQSTLAGSVVVNADILIDPFGRTFDAATGLAIPGVTVTLTTIQGATLAIPSLSGTGSPPNTDNINPFTTTSDGRYAFLFGGNQVGTPAQPAHYIMTVQPPAGSPYPPRRLYLVVNPVNDTGAAGVPITMSVVSADGLALALPNSYTLTADPIIIPDIQTIAFNIPLFGKSPVLAFTKTALQDTVNSGESVDFRIVISNIGNDTARAVSVIDTLNSGWKILNTDAGSTTANIIRWNLGDLQPGIQDTLRVQAEASAFGTGKTTLINRAWAQAEGGQPIYSETAVNVKSVARLEISKNADTRTSQPGENINYEIGVTVLSGSSSVITVRDPLPRELTYVFGSSRPAADYDSLAHSLSWTFSGAAQDSIRKLLFTLTPASDLAPGEHPTRNIATATADSITVASNPADVVVSVPFFTVQKTANPTAAETGDFVIYNVVVQNLSKSDSLSAITVRDLIPFGFGYVKDSARLDGNPLPPDSLRGRDIMWKITGLGAGKTNRLTYRLILGTGAGSGDGVNIVTATASTSNGTTLSAGPARAKVQVRPDLFSLDEVILGRAWVDMNENGIQDENEPPVPGIVLVMEDGTRIIADRMGRFSIPEVRAGDHVLRLMNQNIPEGLEPAPLGVRSADDPWIRFVSVSPSGMGKANFPFRMKKISVSPAAESSPPVKEFVLPEV